MTDAAGATATATTAPSGGGSSPATPAADAGAKTPGAAQDDLVIERLALRVAGLDEDAACKLAQLVAERLTPDLMRPIGTAGMDSLEVEVPGKPGDREQPELLAHRIVDAIGRVLARDRAAGGPDGEVSW